MRTFVVKVTQETTFLIDAYDEDDAIMKAYNDYYLFPVDSVSAEITMDVDKEMLSEE